MTAETLLQDVIEHIAPIIEADLNMALDITSAQVRNDIEDIVHETVNQVVAQQIQDIVYEYVYTAIGMAR